jgi:hypothetical protein
VRREPATSARSPDAVPYPPPLGSSIPPPPAPPEDAGPGRLSPQSVLLGAGAVAVVAAGAATSTDGAAGTSRLVVAALAAVATVASVRAGRRRLRTTEEVLAATAAVLALMAATTATRTLDVPLLAGLVAGFLVVSRVGRTAVTWPVAAWMAAQLAVLAGPAGARLHPAAHVAVVLGTALAGLLIAGSARRAVAVVALVTTVPWWVAGVAEAQRLAWSADAAGWARAAAAGLLAVAAAALLATRSRRTLRPLFGPRPAVPVLSGVVAGAGVAGALSGAGPVGVPTTGYLGLALAAVVAERASTRPGAVVRPAGLAAASTLAGLAVVELSIDGRWAALALLLALAALPALLVAARQPADRPGALPVAVGCLAGATVLAHAGGVFAADRAGTILLVLALATLGAATLLREHRSEVPLAVTGTVVGALALALPGDSSSAAAPLAVLGAALTGYGTLAHRRSARAVGCAALVAAAWLTAAAAEVAALEAWTLPAAAGLLLFSGRRLADAPSWSAWGPALLTGYVPSVLLAVLEPGVGRLLLVVAAATLTTTAASRWDVQAPFVVGAGALVVVALGRLVEALPWPALIAVAAAGTVLVGMGASYENRRGQARAAVGRVADMR